MKKLTVLLTKRYRPLSIAAILDVFQSVNEFYLEEEKKPFFEIELVAADKSVTPLNVENRYEVRALSAVAHPELILIPAFMSGDLRESLAGNAAFVPWLRQQCEEGAELASFCTGAFLLAATGLLDGRKATTHVSAAPQFAASFPKVHLQADAIMTHDGPIYTSGGATSSFHLMLYLIGKYCRRDVAVRTAKLFAIDMDRAGQAYFGQFSPSTEHDDSLVAEAQRRMDSRFRERVTVEEVIRDLPASRRNFIRRFKQATGLTPIEYLQRIRIEAAKSLLEQTSRPIAGVMMDTGYEDAKAFRQVFRRMVGLTPRAYREKFTGTRA